MRPAGEIRQALLEAALVLTTPERSPTMLEMAHHAQVGYLAAKQTIQNMRRAGVVVPVRMRTVDYRAKPVTEYCPRERAAQPSRQPCALREVVSTWSTVVA